MKLSARIWTILAIFLIIASTSEAWWDSSSSSGGSNSNGESSESSDDGDWFDSVKDSWNDAKEKVEDTWDDVKEKAEDTWDDVKEKAEDTWDYVKEKAEYAKDFAGGTLDMNDAYFDMLEANRVDEDTDKYFHARGNYEAANRGPGGRKAAEIISALREQYGQLKGDPPSDKAADEKANEWGRNGGDPNIYRPPNLPDKYKR